MMRGSVSQAEVPAIAPGVHAWRLVLPAVAFSLLWILACYWSTGKAMIEIWARSDTFAHGFVVPAIALWLVWRARAQLATIIPRPNWWALGPLAAAGLGWLLGELASVNAVSQIGLATLLVLAVPAVLGTAVARALAFPLGFLFFAVPVGEFMMPQLMEWTADVSVLGLKATGVPVYRDGLQFIIPSGSWSVVEACSGVRYLIASMMVGTLYAYLNYRLFKRRLMFVGFSILVPVIANWIRAYMIVMIGHLSGNKLATGVDHLIYGWLFFGVVMVIMFWIGAHWREDENKPPPQQAAFDVVRETVPASRLWFAAAAVAAVTVAWPLAYRAIERSDAASSPQLPALGTISGWQAAPGGLTGWRPRFQNPSAELHESFRGPGRSVGFYVGYYRNQGYERKLVSSENVLVKSNDPAWANVRSGAHRIELGSNSVTAHTAELRGADGGQLVAWQWYWINGRLTTSEYWAKGYTALARLMGRGDDSAVVVAYAPRDQPGGGEGAMEAFLRDAAPTIEATLAQTRERR